MNELEYIESTGVQYIDTGATYSQYEAALSKIPYIPFSIKGTKVYDNGFLIENWVPVRTSNGDEGMYDVISESYLDREAFIEKMEEFYRHSKSITVIWN